MIRLIAVIVTASLISGTAYGLLGGDLPQVREEARPAPTESGIIHMDGAAWTGGEPPRRYIVFGQGTGNWLPQVAENMAYTARTDTGFLSVGAFPENARASMERMGYHVIEDFELEFDSMGGDASGIGDIVGSRHVNRALGYQGSGVTVGIADTGVDFSNTDIRDSLARDELNRPIMLDADGQGIVLTNATFVANIDEFGVMRNYTGDLPEGATSRVYVSDDGVFLDLNQGNKGTTIQVYNAFYPYGGSGPVLNGTMISDLKIGTDNRDYIVSQSGVYHLGVIYQPAPGGIFLAAQVVPILVVDAGEAGVYDTIIPDMSTSWEDYTRFDLEPGERPDYDFDFTDETQIQLGEGKEFLVYDSDGDGRDNYSSGTVGAWVLDVHSVIEPDYTAEEVDALGAVNGTLLPPMDPAGNFFGLMTDYYGHGSASAATVASAGQREYDIYGTGEKFNIAGVASEAEILPIKVLWFGDVLYAWMWAAGFDNHDTSWTYSNQTRADIVSNSWGVSAFPNLDAAPGMDVLSLISNAIVTPKSMHPDYPGITMVTSGGNSGPGYGAMSVPATASFGITVGATTNNVFVGYSSFDGEPRFGNTTAHRNHVVDFSGRGPGIIGDPKPDIMGIGAYGFVPAPVTESVREPENNPFSLYGGTSMASPMAAGAAALIVEALQEDGSGYDPFLIKNIMMSTATDLYSDPLAQGAGLVNVGDALRYIRAQPGSFLVHNDATYRNVLDVLESPVASFNSTDLGLEEIALPSRPYPSTPWFAGRLEPGQRSIATFTVENPSGVPLELSVRSQAMGLTDYSQYRGDTVPYETDTVHTGPDAFVPNYIRLSDVRSFETLSDYLETPPPMPDAEMLILTVDFDFDDFMQSRDGLYADDMQIASLYLYDWNDRNADGGISSDELSMVSRAGSWGTVQELRVSDPNSLFEHEPVVGVYPVPIRYSYWTGEREDNVTSIGYTLSAGYYARGDWGTAWITDREVTVPARGSAEISAVIFVPDGTPTGVHQGVISFEGGHKAVHVPVSFIVVEPVGVSNVILRTQGAEVDGVLYGNGYVKGSSDMLANYPSGDWRLYYYDIQDERIDSASFRIEWEDGESSLSVFAVDPGGMIVQSNVPAGVFAELAGWPSNDWLGDTPFGGGGFYPVSGPDDPSTFLHVPINQTGIHALMVHSTLFGGNRTSEPISILASFADLDT
jgi:hypothetical protein